MKDCTIIRKKLVDIMILGRIYDLAELYAMLEPEFAQINNLRHKIRSVLAQRSVAEKYVIEYYGNAKYLLARR